MNCPYCGNEMEVGYIAGGKEAYWFKNDRGFALFPSKAKGDIVIAGAWIGSSDYNSYLCRKCKKIITDLK